MQTLHAKRQTFHDKSLLYMFSFDAEVDGELDAVGWVPGGVRVNIRSKPSRTRVYHMTQSQTVAGIGFQGINGRIRTGADWLIWREDDVEYSELRITIETDEGASILGEYRVVADLLPGGYRRLLGKKERIGTRRTPVDVPVFIAPIFYCSNPNYAWVNDLLCVGYGRVRVVESQFRRVSYDIYAVI